VLRWSEYLGREDWHLFLLCFKIHPVIQTTSAQIQKSRSHLKIPDNRTVICSRVHTKDPQIFYLALMQYDVQDLFVPVAD